MTALALDAPAAVDPAERGLTTLADKVVEKVAARAALDVPHVLGLQRRVAGRALGSPAVRAGVEINGQVAALRLAVALEYPAPARATTRALRRHVGERVTTLCGLTVDHVDVAVTAIRRADPSRRRVL